MKLTRNYLIIFLLLSYAGGFYLRWYQLEFFYRILPTFFSGIGSTLLATFVLMITMGSYNFVVLNRFTKVIQKIKNGEKITDEERKMAIRSQSKINIISLITNMIGFGVGQAFAIIVDVKNGVIVPVPSRLTLIMIQAILVGCLIAIFEIFIVGVLMRDDRRLLKIHSVDELDHDISFSIKYIKSTEFLLIIFTYLSCCSVIVPPSPSDIACEKPTIDWIGAFKSFASLIKKLFLS